MRRISSAGSTWQCGFTVSLVGAPLRAARALGKGGEAQRDHARAILSYLILREKGEKGGQQSYLILSHAKPVDNARLARHRLAGLVSSYGARVGGEHSNVTRGTPGITRLLYGESPPISKKALHRLYTGVTP